MGSRLTGTAGPKGARNARPGWIVIAGSCLRSVPQIVRIVKAKSVEGISLTATVVETLCYTVIVGYSLFHQYVFSSYGDVFACWIQNILLCAMLAWYRKAPLRVWLPSAVAFGAYNWWVISGACGEQMLLLGQISVGFAMSLGARVPQIVLNYRRGNSGELSLITCALSSLGNLARCFTTVILTADWVLFASTFAQFVLNGILTWQCVDTERQNRAAASAADGETKAA